MAVGQKTKPTESFGAGFNYWVEVRFPFAVERERAEQALSETLAVLDHKALGVDVEISQEPNSANLAHHIYEDISRRLGVLVQVRLERGDAWTFESGAAG